MVNESVSDSDSDDAQGPQPEPEPELHERNAGETHQLLGARRRSPKSRDRAHTPPKKKPMSTPPTSRPTSRPTPTSNPESTATKTVQFAPRISETRAATTPPRQRAVTKGFAVSPKPQNRKKMLGKAQSQMRISVNKAKEDSEPEPEPKPSTPRTWPQDWNPQSRGPILCHEGPVNSCCIFNSHHGTSRLLSCADDHVLHVSDLQSGQILKTLQGHTEPVKDCCIFPGERATKALSCGADNKLKVWDLEQGTEDGEHLWDETNGHTKAVNAICIFAVAGETDRLLALSASADGTLKVWDLAMRRPIATLKCTDEKGKEQKSEIISCCVFQTSDGERTEALSGGEDKHVRRWNLSTIGTDGIKEVYEMKHPDSNANSDEHSGAPWLVKHQGHVHACCVSAKGDRALTCSGDRSAIFWDLNTGTEIRTLQHVASVFSCCFLQANKLALTASSFAPRLWDVHSGECLRVFAGHSSDVLHCTVVSDGTKALTCGSGGSIRVWELSAHYCSSNLGGDAAACSHQHTNVVKEIVVFDDGSKAVSCSYDSTAKLWCLRTGMCLDTLEEHTNKVNECCIFPDQQKVLTGSADGTIKVWGFVGGDEKCECQQTLGDTACGEIRGCGVFAGGEKAFSCSKTGSIYIWKMTLEGAGPAKRVAGHERLRTLTGHSGLVDRCCVFNGGTRMISASWDKTCKIWELETGSLLRSWEDDNKVRGVSVFDNDTKAVCVGSGAWISIVDIETGLMLNRWPHNHSSTVWGLRLLSFRVPLQREAAWVKAHVAVTYSADGFVKMWDLDHDAHFKSRTREVDTVKFEIVHARRAFNPTPMCVAVLPPSYELGTFAILVGGYRSIQMNDVSSIGSAASAGAIWAGKASVEPTAWNDWVVDSVMETSPHFLYSRDQKDRVLPTLVHKLANDVNGSLVLRKLLDKFQKERKAIMRGKFDHVVHSNALGTIGMLSRAGESESKNTALSVAIKRSNEDMVQLLLDDYRDHVASYAGTGTIDVPATLVSELTERDIVRLFESFPMLAAEFLQKLPMQATKLVTPNSKCDFAATHQTFVRASTEKLPLVQKRSGGQFLRYWDEFIHERWLRTKKNDRSSSADNSLKEAHQKRMEDTAWGVHVKAERVPLRATRNRDEDITEDKTNKKNDIRPPFSALLECACEHASKTKDVAIFESVALEAIVQYKWEESARQKYVLMVWGYATHIVLFSIVTINFEVWLECSSPGTFYDVNTTHLKYISDNGLDPTGEMVDEYGLWAYPCITLDSEGVMIDSYANSSSWTFLSALGFTMGAYSTFYTCVMLKHEFHQATQERGDYAKDFWNMLDLSSAFLSLVSIILMVVYYSTGESSAEKLRFLDVVQAHALLLGWIKVLYFLRGLDYTASLVYMLMQITQSMASFMIVLLVVLIAFATSFNLMLRHDLVKPDRPNGEEEETMFDTTLTSLFGVWGMTFGAFEVDHFREAISDEAVAPWMNASWISLIDLALFLGFVPLVMLNSVIAIMSDTYNTVKHSRQASKVQNRAELILEMEGLMQWEESDDTTSNSAVERTGQDTISKAFRNLFSMSIPYSHYPGFLHKLSTKTYHVEADDISVQIKGLSQTTSFLLEQFEAETHNAKVTREKTNKNLNDVMAKLDHLLGGHEEEQHDKVGKKTQMLEPKHEKQTDIEAILEALQTQMQAMQRNHELLSEHIAPKAERPYWASPGWPPRD